ncbi:MAG: 3-isopropylmalate dehydratase [Prolixibacteraceae bacterium]|nr:3-isopropylmalate dehydratase [Prolixibacteraceae bacterium]
MKITDRNGQEIEVTDLAAAIAQARCFRGFHHVPPNPVTDKKRQAYWADIHCKLIRLQSKRAKDKNRKHKSSWKYL